MSSPTPHPLARPVGYALVLAALVGTFLAAVFFVHELTRSPRLIRVHFPEIATLSEGDPVVQGGVPVGVVRAIRLPDSASSESASPQAVVTIELFNSRPLARDSRFVNFSHSLMGARKVWIEPGASSNSSAALPLDESRIQEGVFAPGLPETLRRIDSLVVIVAALRAQTERLLTDEDPLRSPVAATRVFVGRLDSAAAQLQKLTAGLESARVSLQSGLAGFSSAAGKTRQGVRAAEPPVRSALLKAREVVNAVESVQTNLDTLLTRMEKVGALAGDSAGAGGLLNNDRAYANLEKSVRVLERVASLMEKDGLGDSLKIKPRLRKH